MSRQSDVVARLRADIASRALQIADSSTPLSATEAQQEVLSVADSSTPLSAKRNRSGVCDNPAKHLAHDACPGRKRAAKVARPVDSSIAASVDAISQAAACDPHQQIRSHFLPAL
jgi:hypothetical protein